MIKASFAKRAFARVRALLPKHWNGDEGTRFRKVIDDISDYSKENIRINEKLKHVPDVAWDSLRVKQSETLLKVAEKENKEVDTRLAQMTMIAKTRQEEATATKLEFEAQASRDAMVEGRLRLYKSFKEANAIPVWDDAKHEMYILPAPADYDWQGLWEKLVSSKTEPSKQVLPEPMIELAEETRSGFGPMATRADTDSKESKDK